MASHRPSTTTRGVWALALVGGVAGLAPAQMDQAWMAVRPGSPGNLLQAGNGDLIVSGSMVVPSNIGGAAFHDSILARYSPEGSLLWAWQSNESQDDFFREAALDAQGNILAVGRIGTSFWGQAPHAIRIVKLSPSGQRLWTVTYATPLPQFGPEPFGIRVAPDGGFLIFGQEYGTGTERDIFIARFGPTGTHEWTFRRAGPVWDHIIDVALDPAGNAYWVGSSNRADTSLNGACLGKIDPSGRQQWLWQQPAGNNSGGGLVSLGFDPAGNIVASGFVEYFPGFQDGLLLRLDPAGNELLSLTWDGPDGRWDRFFTHAVLSDSSVVVSGDTYAGDGWEYYDVPTLRFDAGGSLLWSDIFGSSLYAPNDVEEWALNMFALPGDEVLTISTDWARPGYDYALHRYSADGQLLERVVRDIPNIDIKDIPHHCALVDGDRHALFILGWGGAPPGAANTDHLKLIRVALPSPPSLCAADLDDGSFTGTPDGGVTIEDLLYFLDRFGAGDLATDLDDGTGAGTPDAGVTIDDLLFFLARFDLGC